MNDVKLRCISFLADGDIEPGTTNGFKIAGKVLGKRPRPIHLDAKAKIPDHMLERNKQVRGIRWDIIGFRVCKIEFIWLILNMPRSSLDIKKNEHHIFQTAGESAMREWQIVEEHGCKLLEEDKSENPNVPLILVNDLTLFGDLLLKEK